MVAFMRSTGVKIRTWSAEGRIHVQGLGKGYQDLSGTAAEALESLQSNTAGVMKAFGAAHIPHFTLSQLSAASARHHAREEGKQRGGVIGLARGGFTVPGTGTGDSFPYLAENGGFVMNRKAAKVHGFARGGYTRTMLEPQEHYFTPQEVRSYGRSNLEAANNSVPRFAKGGTVNEPLIKGSGALGELGQSAVHMAYKTAQAYIKNHRPKMAGGSDRVTGNLADWLTQALKITGHYSASNLRGLIKQALSESGGNPHAINLWDSNAAAGHPSKGLLQTIDSTFNAYKMKGYGNIWNPIDNAIAAIRYMYAAYGHIVSTGSGYEEGGIVGMSRGGNFNPFNEKLMKGAHSSGPRKQLLAGHGGFLPKTIERIKAKADVISRAFKGYQQGPGHDEGTHVRSNILDCSAAIAKLLQQSGWTDFPVGVSGDYEHIFHPGSGDKFTIWSNAEHTFADIEGKQWGTNSSNGLGYHTHPHGGFVPRHPSLNAGLGGGGGGASGVGGNHFKKPQAKKSVKGSFVKHHAGDTSAGGTFGQDVRGKYHITTSKLSFGPLPKTMEACKRELNHLERVVLPEYRTAVRQHKDDRPTAAALRVNVKAIEMRIKAVRTQVSKLRLSTLKKHLSARIAKTLARITGWEGGIELQRKAYDRAVEYAEQVVELEPLEPGTVTKDWVDNVLAPYIRGQEEPALGTVLGRELSWRNTILTAEEGVAATEGKWQGEATGLSERITNMKANIDKSNHRIGDLGDLIRSRPKAKDRPKWIAQKKALEANLPEMHSKLNSMRARKGLLLEALTSARESFDPARGTGSFEDSLTEVQGLHWPGLHEKLAALPVARAAGSFGGAIWDTQRAISELGMKLTQANEAVGGNAKEDESEKSGLLKQLLEDERSRNAVLTAQYGVLQGFSPLKNFGGSFATGGIVSGPSGAERLTVAHGGEGVFTEAQMAAMGTTDDTKPTLIVHGDIISAHPDPFEMVVGNKQFAVEVQKVTGKDDRRLSRGVGKGLPGKAGRFGG
jgi:hypothetical protein